MTILVAEPLAEAAVALLKSQPGWNIIVSNPKEYAKHLAEAVMGFDRPKRRPGESSGARPGTCCG